MGLWRLLLAWLAWGCPPGPPPARASSADPFLQKAGGGGGGPVNTTAAVSTGVSGPGCGAQPPPQRGAHRVEEGSGTSVGSVLSFWCQEGYQLVGSERVTCVLQAGGPQWSRRPPECEAIPKPKDHGLHLAILISVASGLVILATSAAFIACCVRERRARARVRAHGGRREARDRLKGSKGHAPGPACWFDREEEEEEEEDEEEEWGSTPAKRLSQRLDPRLPAPGAPLFLGALGGYENRGYQRSQENLLRVPLPGLGYDGGGRAVYPHVVLQRVPTPTAPVYFHLPPRPPPGPVQLLPAFASPHGVPHSVPHNVPHNIPHSVHHSVHHSIPHNVPHNVPQSVAHSVAHNVPHNLPHNVPQRVAHRVPQSTPHRLWH
ncbi:uncharacterized protein [Lepisosteus oculatus]|uniref:uncharacterized protein n=1 Tax=Lepisosteus oculatus TaxID=7918 RepID=UPI00371EA06D